MAELNAAIRDIALPERMRRLPVSDKGFPVPWFVAKVDGAWEFRLIRPGGIAEALHERCCWLCGEPLEALLCFTVGPESVASFRTVEPPSHVECARYAVRACPFLSNPRMRRNERDLAEHAALPGSMEENPGLYALYATRSFATLRRRSGFVFLMGEAESIEWYAEGKEAQP